MGDGRRGEGCFLGDQALLTFDALWQSRAVKKVSVKATAVVSSVFVRLQSTRVFS